MKTKKEVIKKLALFGGIAGFIIGLLMLIPFLNILLSCLVCLAIPLAIGGIGAYSAKEHGATKDNAIDGLKFGFFGTVAFTIPYTIIYNILTSILMIAGVTINTGFMSKFSASDATSIASIIMGAFVGILLQLIMFCVIGAIGGLIMAAVTDSEKK